MMMPPYPLWMRGATEYGKWLHGGGCGCRGSRLAPDRRERRAGVRAVARRVPTAGTRPGRSTRVEISDGRITGINFFVDANLFPLFGLPVRLEQ